MDSRRRSSIPAATRGWPLILSVAALILVALFFLFLFGGLLAYSWKASWHMALRSDELRCAALLTLRTTLASTVAASVLALACAYALARLDFPGKAFVEALLDMPIVLPPLASGVALLIFFGPMVGGSLANAGLSIVFSQAGVMVAQGFIALPFAVRLFREAFSSIDPQLEGIARNLGCTPGAAFLKITLPLARRGIASGVAMTWARTVGEFGATAMLAGVTRMKTETLSAAIFLDMSAGELEDAIVVSVLLFVAAMAVLVVYRALTAERSRPIDSGPQR